MNQTKTMVSLGLVVIAAILLAGGIYAFTKVGNQIAPVPLIVSTSTPTTSTDTTPITKPGIPVPTPHAFGSVTLSLGEAARFAGLTITPLSIVQDSRCPIDVQCIQAGTVQVSVRVAASSGTSVQTLTLNKPYASSGITITLTSVTPAKKESSTIAASEYRLTFDVEKNQPVALGKCYVGGCSSETCSDQPGAVSTCIYRPEFACYRYSTCERQPSGACGWTPNAQLNSCLANPPSQGYTL